MRKKVTVRLDQDLAECLRIANAAGFGISDLVNTMLRSNPHAGSEAKTSYLEDHVMWSIQQRQRRLVERLELERDPNTRYRMRSHHARLGELLDRMQYIHHPEYYW